MALGLIGVACEAAEPPPHWHRIELVGPPYERGYQHGEAFASEIRSLYTRLLTTSIIPYVNRERSTIAEYLFEYQEPKYDDGEFAYLVFLESALQLETYLPQDYVDEMHGIADGAGLEYDKVLLLNTFFDTLMAFRAMSMFLAAVQAPDPVMLGVTGVEADGADNDGDGAIDEPGEGTLEPYDPSGWANLVEAPVDTTVVLRLEAPQGVDPARLRIQYYEELFTADDPEIETEIYGEEDEGLEVRFRLSEGFPPASYVPLIISAGDTAWDEDPPPARAHMMRDMRIGFTTAGYGKLPHEVPSPTFDDGRSQPPPTLFAARGSATADGAPLLGHHFALLDSNTSHEHCAIFLHRPDEGRAHVTVGWTGALFGFSGMNEDGVAYGVNYSDTLDNPLAAEFRDLLVFAKFLSSGVVIGVLGRELLRTSGSTAEAVAYLRDTPVTYGWNFMVADDAGDIALVEVDSNINDDATSFWVVRPDTSDASNVDSYGRPWASVGPDDLRSTVHFRPNAEDMRMSILGYEIRQQRFWSSYWYRSQRTWHLLGDALQERYGALDVPAAQQILGMDELVDQRDSMNAVVFEPSRLRLHVAFGQVPATAGPFIPFDMNAWLDGEDP